MQQKSYYKPSADMRMILSNPDVPTKLYPTFHIKKTYFLLCIKNNLEMKRNLSKSLLKKKKPTELLDLFPDKKKKEAALSLTKMSYYQLQKNILNVIMFPMEPILSG